MVNLELRSHTVKCESFVHICHPYKENNAQAAIMRTLNARAGTP